MYYYSSQEKRSYKNESDILREMIFAKGLHTIGFNSWQVKNKIVNFMNQDYIQKTYTIYYTRNNKRTSTQKTVYEINKKEEKNQNFFTIENYIEYAINSNNILTPYGKYVYSQLLLHYTKYTSITELKNNLFIC